MNVWVTWNFNSLFIHLFILVLLTIYFLVERPELELSKATLFTAMMLAVIAAYSVLFTELNVSGFFGQIVTFSILLFVLLLPKKTQNDILDDITKWFSFLMLISLVLYALALFSLISPFRIDTPSYDTSYPDFENYIFYVKPIRPVFFIRFNGPFVEPGHLGMICAFLLYANKFDFKRFHTSIILISLLLTLSLAGYILVLLGLLLTYSKHIKSLLIALAVTTITAFIIINDWNDGENIVNELIFNRLAYDDEKGISGNNRFQNETNYVFNEMLKSNDIWLGIHNTLFENFDIPGSGYKIYILRNGIIGTLLLSILYFLIALNAIDKRYSFCFLIIITAAFMQRSYPFWFAWFFLYVGGIAKADLIKQKVMHTNLSTPKLSYIE